LDRKLATYGTQHAHRHNDARPVPPTANQKNTVTLCRQRRSTQSQPGLQGAEGLVVSVTIGGAGECVRGTFWQGIVYLHGGIVQGAVQRSRRTLPSRKVSVAARTTAGFSRYFPGQRATAVSGAMKQLELYAPCTARTVDQLARGLAQVLTADVLLQAGQFL
jgi:hypothetical protein